MVSRNVFESRYKIDLKDYVGKEFCLDQDTAHLSKLVAALQVVRYDDFSSGAYSRSAVILLPENRLASGNEICLRTNKKRICRLCRTIDEGCPSQYRVGNLFLTKVSSFRDIRHTFQLDDMNTLRNYLVGMGFCCSIFSGAIGNILVPHPAA